MEHSLNTHSFCLLTTAGFIHRKNWLRYPQMRDPAQTGRTLLNEKQVRKDV